MSKRQDKSGPGRAQAAPNVADFKAYDAGLHTLIPLNKPRATRVIEKKGKSVTVKTGKRPLHGRWTTAPYNTAKVIAEAEKSGRNVGVRLCPTQVVIDVDPRHGGDDAFADLCLDIDLDPLRYPCVTTGGGGLHLYATLPPGVAVVDTVPGYGGVEFKSVGRQVLAAGCVHPDTGKRYTFTPGHPGINVQVAAPDALVALITRPERPPSVGGGHVSPDRLARALACLDPCDFREHDRWLRMMMACHHATGGDGRDVFIEWSTSDPNYSDMAEVIGRRWDSLHADHASGVTAATINMWLHEAGAKVRLRTSAAEDFADSDFIDVPGALREPRPLDELLRRAFR